MTTTKCAYCGATIEFDETRTTNFCTNCGKPIAKSVASNHTTGEKTASADEFAELVQQYYSYVNQYNIDFKKIIHLCTLLAEVQMWGDTAKHSASTLELKKIYAENERQYHNERVDIYNSSVYFDSADERRERSNIDTSLSEYHRKMSEVSSAERQVESDIVKIKQKLQELQQYKEEFHKTVLKMPTLAYQTVETMLKKYPNNPLGLLYLADWNRREAMWRLNTWKKAFEYVLPNWDELQPQSERLYDIFEKEIENKKN